MSNMTWQEFADEVTRLIEPIMERFGHTSVKPTPIEAATAYLTSDNATRPISDRASELVDTVTPAIMRDLAVRFSLDGHHNAADTLITWANETETDHA